MHRTSPVLVFLVNPVAFRPLQVESVIAPPAVPGFPKPELYYRIRNLSRSFKCKSWYHSNDSLRSSSQHKCVLTLNDRTKSRRSNKAFVAFWNDWGAVPKPCHSGKLDSINCQLFQLIDCSLRLDIDSMRLTISSDFGLNDG